MLNDLPERLPLPVGEGWGEGIRAQLTKKRPVRPLLSTSSSNPSAARGAPVANQAQIIAFHGLNQPLIIQLTVQPLA